MGFLLIAKCININPKEMKTEKTTGSWLTRKRTQKNYIYSDQNYKKATLRLMKVNWEEQPWQCEASATQLFPRSEGFGGNPIFSSILL